MKKPTEKQGKIAMNKPRPIITENVEGGVWSLTVYFGKGDDARDAMRAMAAALRNQRTKGDAA
jgi:hypothetical protein